MKKILLLLFVIAAGGGQSVWAQSGEMPTLAGKWAGPLVVPGGTASIGLVVSQTGSRTTAVIESPLALLNGHPLVFTARHDTLNFFDPRTQASYTCMRSSDGQLLVGRWDLPGFSHDLVMSFQTPPATARPAKKNGGATAARPMATAQLTLPMTSAN